MRQGFVIGAIVLFSSACGGAPAGEPAAPAAPQHASAFGYEGANGPEHWGELDDAWRACKTGTSQTPVDIVTKGLAPSKDLAALAFSYEPLPLRIKNTGHIVQAEGSERATLTAAGGTWRLLQFHVHTPSEHTIDGKHEAAELHLVHTNAKGALAVVGLLLRSGKESATLAPFFESAPSDVSKEATPVSGKSVDLAALLPKNASYYTYPGSLTTPPCTEGVTWLVLADPVEVSEAQLAKLRAATHGDTSRPVQPLGARTVAVFR